MKPLTIFIIALFSTSVVSSDCLNYEQQKEERIIIRQLLSKSAQCKVDNECKLVYLGCPFGCGTAINVNSEIKVLEAVHSYHSKSCRGVKISVSENHQCNV
jgi:hypothetical protein